MSILKNKITCKDITIDNLDLLFNDTKVDCMYVDPPWGEANLRYWRTMNNQKEYPVNWIFFLNRLFFIYSKNLKGKPAFIETGKRFVNDIVNVFGNPQKIFTCLYKSGNKKYENKLLVYNHVLNVDVTNKRGLDLVLNCLKSVNLEIVFDQWVGLGMTDRACNKLNIILLANELNKNRAERTAKIMETKVIT